MQPCQTLKQRSKGHPRQWLGAILLIVLASVACVPSIAQPALDSLVFTVGTTAHDTQNRPWAHLLWQARANDIIKGRAFAVYQKTGAPNSAEPFERMAIVTLQRDPGAIGVLLSRGAQIGDDLGELNEVVTSLFQSLMPVGQTNLPQKLAVVIQGAQANPSHFNNLVLLSRTHPGLSLCLGFAHAQLLPGPGPFTFEVRAFDVAKDQDLAVVGRVTLDAANPLILPAPGAPVQVPEFSGHLVYGHLNAKFRWATEPPLRRLALLNHGFNLYRMTRSFAESHNYHLQAGNPLTTEKLLGHLNTDLAQVARVNVKPILTSSNFGPADVAVFINGTNAFFTSDDNRRYDPGGTPHHNGDQFYYFLTARGILGRDGLVSKPSALVTMCDRFPPDPPKGLAIENSYTYDPVQKKSNQVLRATWKQNVNTSEEAIVRYHLYRWSSVAEMIEKESNPLANRIATTNYLNGQTVTGVTDSNLVNSPTLANDTGKTFWYSVRAEDNGVCGGNLSGNCPPVFGVLRDRERPPPPTGVITIQCCRPAVTNERSADVPGANLEPSLAYYQIVFTRTSPEIERMEVFAFDPAQPTNQILCAPTAGGRVAAGEDASSDCLSFPPGRNNQLTLDFSLDRAAVGRTPLSLYARAYGVDGVASDFSVASNVGAPSTTQVRQLSLSAGRDCRQVPVVTNALGLLPDCTVHDPQPPNGSGKACIKVCLNLTSTTREWRLYRRVDDGPQSLLRQDLADYATTPNHQVCWDDCDLPVNPGEVRYYGQLFDEHGNGSSLVLLGPSILIKGKKHKPLLAPLEPQGPPGSQMVVRWFCPPYGIKRFKVYVSENGSAPPQSISMELSDKDGEVLFGQFPAVLAYGIYKTPMVGPGFGNGAMFSVTVNVEPPVFRSRASHRQG